MKKHPFEWIQPTARARVFSLSTVAAIIILVALQISGAPLKTEAAPAGIISYEFAGSIEAAQLIILSWQPEVSAWAGFNLGLDYLFLVAYALAISLGCILLSQKLSLAGIRGGSILVALAWGLILAAVLDAVENFALLQTLFGSQSSVWPVLAAWCAGPKFILVLLGLMGLAVGGSALAVNRFRAPSAEGKSTK